MNVKKTFKSDKGRTAVFGVYDEILKIWRVPYETLWIDSTFGKTFVIKCGDSSHPPLILLHGTSSNSSLWMGEAEEFAKNYCVYAIDIPGEPGKSEEKQYPLRGSAHFEWLNEIVITLKLNKISIVGISLGAWIGLGYATKYPEKVEKLALLCPSGVGRQKVSFIFKALPLMLLGDWGFNKITQLVNGKQIMLKEAQEYTKLIARSFNLRTEPVPIYSDDELRQLKMPVLLFAGENDVMLNSKETVNRMSRLVPNIKSTLLSGYGHVLIGFQNEIMNFLLE